MKAVFFQKFIKPAVRGDGVNRVPAGLEQFFYFFRQWIFAGNFISKKGMEPKNGSG